MQILKAFQLGLVIIFFLQFEVSAQFSQLNIDVNIDPDLEIAIAQETQNDDLALVIKKDVFSTNIRNRNNYRFLAPSTAKEEKLDGENVTLSMISDKGHFKVKIDDDYNGEVHFQFLDSNYRLLERKTKFIRDGKNRIVFKNDYKPGTYILTINYNGELLSKQILIE